MYCKNCGKKVKEGTKFCAHCGTKTVEIKKSDAAIILNVFKNIFRVIIMFILLLYILALYTYPQTFICWSLSFILLIPPVAKWLYEKFKINRIIKYVLIIALLFIGIIDVEPISENNSTDKNKNIEIVEKEEIIKTINLHTYIHSRSKQKVELKKEGDYYIAIIPFDTLLGYTKDIYCADDGLKVINNLKKDHKEEVDNKINKYILKFYTSNSEGSELLYTAEYDNSNKDSEVEELIITNKKDGTTKSIKTSDVAKYYEDINDKYNNTPSPSPQPAFDENNINKSVSCNGKKITVKKIKRVTKNESTYVPVGKEWIGVYIVFENKSKEDKDYYESDFNLVNNNGEIIEPSFTIIKGIFDHERLNNGTLTAGGKREGYVMFDNSIIGDTNLSLRIVCEDKLIADDEVKTIKLHD